MGFISAALLGGTALIAVPIIIHLLSKRQQKLRDWAAMSFLLEAHAQNRRRVRLEDLLLLLLRCLIVALIALLVSRPFWEPKGGAALLDQGMPSEWILLLDDSPSMAAQDGNSSSLGQAKRTLLTWLDRLETEQRGDSLTLITTSRPQMPLAKGVYIQSAEFTQLKQELEALSVSDHPAELDEAFSSLRKLMQEEGGNLNRNLLLVSDFREVDWVDGAAELSASGSWQMLEELAEEADEAWLLDVGSPVSNLSVEDLRALNRQVLAGIPHPYTVRVANWGEAAVSDVQLSVQVEGASPLFMEISEIAAGERATALFYHTVEEAGSVALEVEIDQDSLGMDNLRYASVPVKENIPLLLVNGEPDLNEAKQETFFLRKALSPPGSIVSGYQVEEVELAQWVELDFAKYDLVILSNLFRLTESQIAQLKAFVQEGGGLIWYLGDQVDPEHYNQKLLKEGLMPFALELPLGNELKEEWVTFVLEDETHPVLEWFSGTRNPFLDRVKFFQWWGMDPAKPGAAESPKVIAAFSDPASSPAVVEHRLGSGRILTFSSSADLEWNHWPAEPSYVVSVLEAAAHTARMDLRQHQLLVGEPLLRSLPSRRYSGRASLLKPQHPEAIQLQALVDQQSGNIPIRYTDTDLKGIYTLNVETLYGEEEAEHIAVNLDPGEGNLTYTGAETLIAQQGEGSGLQIFDRNDARESSEERGGRIELWRWILLFLLVSLGLEFFAAWYLGRSREVPA